MAVFYLNIRLLLKLPRSVVFPVTMIVSLLRSIQAFRHQLKMMHFLQKLRTLSGGKPVGFKLCIGQPWQFMSIVKAMLETKIVPDFIVVDGSEGGTGAALLSLVTIVGTPLREGLRFVRITHL